jgi:hypothetical protein
MQNHKKTKNTIKIRKQVEPKLDENVLKTTGYTKQWINHTIQYLI